MGKLDRASTALARRMQASASSNALAYRRGAELVDLTGKAWWGRTVFSRIPRDGGPAVVFGDRDYLIPASELAIDGTQFEPEEGHRIAEEIDGRTREFEIIAPTGEPPWRWSDPGRTIYRVHTKEQR